MNKRMNAVSVLSALRCWVGRGVGLAVVLGIGAGVWAQGTGGVSGGGGVAAEAQDRGWPRLFEAQGHHVLVFQPQIEEWVNFEKVTFQAAVSVTLIGSNKPTFGIIRATADTEVDKGARLVALTNKKVLDLSFPDVAAGEAERLKGIVLAAMPPGRPQTISLDRMVAAVDPAKIGARSVEVNMAPPQIVYSDRPAVMVVFMGKPRFTKVEGTGLMVAINTNWDVFVDSENRAYYLRDEKSWMAANDVVRGPWVATVSLPPGLAKLPADENWADVRAAVPGVAATVVPKVIVSESPAELVVTAGAPQMEAIPGTGLKRVTNTESDLFFYAGDRKFYLLAAGRWFRAGELEGPWSAASDSLPADFRKIPEDSAAGEVLASVPGTAEANEAVVMASIPDKATVVKSEVTVEVTYQGTPEFRPIESTPIRYGYNTAYDVFAVEGRYYCCYNGVWFVGNTPTGPWGVADAVPAVIYTIPPTSPKFNVTYVRVYSSTPTTVVTGYTSGYTGEQVAATGVVMFGVGLAVGAVIANNSDDFYWSMHYRSSYYSYGSGARWYGGTAVGHQGGYVSTGRVYGPYGGAGRVASYNPQTGVYQRGGYAYGPSGAAGYRSAYNPATGMGAARAGGTTPYGSWSRGVVSNGDDWVRGGQRTTAGGGSVGAVQGSNGAGAVRTEGRFGNGTTVAKSESGDYYAAKDGKVYKNTGSGWEQANNNKPTPYGEQGGANRTGTAEGGNRTAPQTTQNLQRDAASRKRGDSRASAFQGSGGNRSSPSRGGGGGGGGRGGGGRR